jgi:hypothetical protein
MKTFNTSAKSFASLAYSVSPKDGKNALEMKEFCGKVISSW